MLLLLLSLTCGGDRLILPKPETYPIPITYCRCSYDVTKCMFSSGNITEKLRIAGFRCHEETIVDLFAGKPLTPVVSH